MAYDAKQMQWYPDDEEKLEIDWKDRPFELNETYYLTNDGFVSQDDMNDYFYTKFDQYTGEEIYRELV